MIEALENLKEWSHHCDCVWLLANGSYVITDGHEPEKAIKNIGESLRELADEIQAEVDSKYLLLPVDAEGEVIHIGDMLKNSSGTTRVVSNVGLGGHDNTFSAWDFIAGDYRLHGGSYWHHVKPSESASEGDTAPVSVPDECEPAKDESGPQNSADSREKLELDIRGSLGFTTKDVFGWLDRQAAITRSETVTECDRLRERIDELQKRNCPGYEPENHRCRWHDADFELNADRLNDLRRENSSLENLIAEMEAESENLKARIKELEEENTAWRDWKKVAEHMQSDRDYWRDLYKLSHAEPHEIAENPQKTPEQQWICKTCRWFEPEKWVKTGKGTENFRHAKCHRGPGSFATDANDWCGEWSE